MTRRTPLPSRSSDRLRVQRHSLRKAAQLLYEKLPRAPLTIRKLLGGLQVPILTIASLGCLMGPPEQVYVHHLCRCNPIHFLRQHLQIVRPRTVETHNIRPLADSPTANG